LTVVVGTAGHIDHGKTSLLRALTGIDADRLPEERRRGMTIDVGYAHLRLADGSELDFVDVPGHDRLVGNMLVGAGEIDAVLLVVAADDGPRAQTIEHLELLDALGISIGIVALTKVDAVDPARVTEVEEQIRATLSGMTLEGSPVLPVSSVDGRGLAELTGALVRLRDRVLEQAGSVGRSGVRLAVDRAFVIKGRGPVVSGSLRGGRLTRGDQLRLVPGSQAVRAREVQVHGAEVASAADGGRVAVNLAGIEAAELHRGMVLTTDRNVVASNEVLAVLHAGRVDRASAASEGWPPKPGRTFRLHLGTDQVEARLGRGRRDRLALSDGSLATRLRFARPIAVAGDDRFVLRPSAQARPPIGGLVLDPLAPTGPSRRRVTPERLAGLASPDGPVRVRALLEIHGVLAPDRLPAGGSEPADGLRLAGLVVDPGLGSELESNALATVTGDDSGPDRSRAEVRVRLIGAVRRLATISPTDAGRLADAILDRVVASGRLAQAGDRVHLPGRAVGPSPAVLAAMDRLEARLATPAPPALSIAARETGCPAEGVRALESSGRIIRIEDDLAYAAPAYGALARTALQLAEAGPLAPAALRDATGTSRKYVMAILEDLDRRGILRRTAEGHRPGPRAALAAGLGRTGP
jgi:selenocysteine-specific elongation factor